MLWHAVRIGLAVTGAGICAALGPGLAGSSAHADDVPAPTPGAADGTPTSPEAAFAAQPPRSAITLLSAPPAKVTPPTWVTFTFRVTGAEVDTTEYLTIRSVSDHSRFSGGTAPTPDAGLSVTAPATVMSLPRHDVGYPPPCIRGGGTWHDPNIQGEELQIPARASAVLTARMRVPVGFSFQGVEIEAVTGPMQARHLIPGMAPAPFTEFTTRLYVQRSGPSIDGVSLTARRPRGGIVSVTGDIESRRAGVPIEIVAKRASRNPENDRYGEANGVLGPEALAMSRRLHVVARTTTSLDGKFRVAMRVDRPLHLVARSRRHGRRLAGASCPVTVRP